MIEETDQGLVLLVYIQPGASRNQISGQHDGALKLKIQAPPVDGKANENLIQFISEFTKVSKKNISLLSGEKSRHKKILLRGISRAELERLISK